MKRNTHEGKSAAPISPCGCCGRTCARWGCSSSWSSCTGCPTQPQQASHRDGELLSALLAALVPLPTVSWLTLDQASCGRRVTGASKTGLTEHLQLSRTCPCAPLQGNRRHLLKFGVTCHRPPAVEQATTGAGVTDPPTLMNTTTPSQPSPTPPSPCHLPPPFAGPRR